MERILLAVIIAAGPRVASSHAEHQYVFVYDQKNQADARTYCRDKHTDLATVETMEDMNRLIAMADLSRMVYASNSYRAWIGLYDDVNSWRWSLAQTAGAGYRKWSAGEPNNKDGQEHCGQMYDDGTLNDEACEGAFYSICSNVSGSDVTFVLVTIPMSWTQAQNYCRANYTDLASVRNLDENQRAARLVPRGARVWIGLFRDAWKWLDGSSSSFRFWKNATNEPNNNEKDEICVAADFGTGGQWADWRCEYQRAFVCQDVVLHKRVVKMRLEPHSSSVNLNDPAVLDDIMKQFQQMLKDKGVDGGVRLSWVKKPDGSVFRKEKSDD